MAFQGNVITATGPGGAPQKDSSATGGFGRSATGSIRSQTFLSAPKLKPGGIQELVHGVMALSAAPATSNLEVIVQDAWTRHIEQYENITVNGDATHEHDDSLYAEFDPPGTMENHYLNNDVRRYFLNGHHLWIDEKLTEEVGLGAAGQEVTLTAIRYGNDTIHVNSWPNSDTTTIHGDQIGVHTGSKYEFSAAAASTSLVLGAHFESFEQGSSGNPSAEVAKLHGADAGAFVAGINSISGRYQKGFAGLSASDPARVPGWNAPSSTAWPQIKTLVFTGLNLNFKLTLEFTYATMRAAFSTVGGSFRGYHSFMNGWHPVFIGVKAGLDALHTNFSALCGRVIATLGFGNPRAPVPSPPTVAELEAAAVAAGDAAKAAATVATDAAAEEAAAQIAVDEAAAQEAAAQTAADEAAAQQAAAQTAADEAAAQQAAAQTAADEAAAQQAAAQTAADEAAAQQAAAQTAADEAAAQQAAAQTAADEAAAQQAAAQTAADEAAAQEAAAQTAADEAAAQEAAAQTAADEAAAQQAAAQTAADEAAAQEAAAQTAADEAAAQEAAAQTAADEAAAQEAAAQTAADEAATQQAAAQTAADEAAAQEAAAQTAVDQAAAQQAAAQTAVDQAAAQQAAAQTAVDQAAAQQAAAQTAVDQAAAQQAAAQTAADQAAAQQAAAQTAADQAAAQQAAAQTAADQAAAQQAAAQTAADEAAAQQAAAQTAVDDAAAEQSAAQTAAQQAAAQRAAAQAAADRANAIAGTPLGKSAPPAGSSSGPISDHHQGPAPPGKR